MIPKILHFCWLSGDSYPPLIQSCLDSWNKYLPDYEIILWDTKRFDINSTLWTKQAYERKKYAFAADYIRLYALYNYGGIYLDSDVMVYKSFNDLLHLPYFVGQDYCGAFEPAVIGAEKGCIWIKDVLERYANRPFVKRDGTNDFKALPVIFFEQLYPKYSFTRISEIGEYECDGKNIVLFDRAFFNARNSIGPHPTSNSYCCHNYAGAWVSRKKDIKSRIKMVIPKWMLKIIYDISHATYKKKEIHQFDPIYMQEHRNI